MALLLSTRSRAGSSAENPGCCKFDDFPPSAKRRFRRMVKRSERGRWKRELRERMIR